MARGGQRDGAGRKRGIPNRFAKANIEKAEKTGILPVDYMLAVMRNSKAGNDRRDAMARAAAPYLHPRLATVEHKAEGFDLSKLTDEELEQLHKMQTRLESSKNSNPL